MCNHARRVSFAALALAGLLQVATSASAQQGTDIFLASLHEGSGGPLIGAAVNVTSRLGYDNQPWFVDDSSFFYSASVDTSGATDVFRYDIHTATAVRITHTPESEYSPTVMPGGEHFSSVRVELDGTQRLWRFGMDGGNPEVIAPAVDSVGYHAWSDENTVVVFIVGEPHSLRIIDVTRGTETLVALDIGRALHTIPGSDEISFLHHGWGRGDGWAFMRLDAETGAATPLAPALEGSRDCAWTPSGSLLMARDSSVYVLDGGGRWSPVVSFGDAALGSITRLAVDPSGSWIAIVASEADSL